MTNAKTRLVRLLATLPIVAVPWWPGSAGAQSLDGIDVEIEPSQVDVLLGESIDFEVTITNRTDTDTPPLVVHIDVTNPSRASSVDPEDWTETLSKSVGVVEPGRAKVVSWNAQPISGGQFVLYAVALTPGATNVASSNVLAINVTERRSLNPEGILPVSIGGPVLVGGLWLAQTRLARRRDAAED